MPNKNPNSGTERATYKLNWVEYRVLSGIRTARNTIIDYEFRGSQVNK